MDNFRKWCAVWKIKQVNGWDVYKRQSLQRLIREPIQELKQLEDEEKQKEYQNILKTLFRMYEDE